MRPAPAPPSRVDTDSSRNIANGEREHPVEVKEEEGNPLPPPDPQTRAEAGTIRNFADGDRQAPAGAEKEIGALFDAQDGVRMIMTEDGPITFSAWCEQDDRDQEEVRHDAIVDDVVRGCRELNLPHLIFIELAGDSWQEKARAYNEYRSMLHAKCGLDPLIEFRKPKWARAAYLPHLELADGTEFNDAWDGTKMIMHEEGPLTLQQWNDYQKHIERGRGLAIAWTMQGRNDAVPPTRRGSPSMGSPVVDIPMAQDMDPQEVRSFPPSHGPSMHNDERCGNEFYHNNRHVDEESFEQFVTSSPFIRHALSSDNQDGYPKIPPPSPLMGAAHAQEVKSSPVDGHSLESDDGVPYLLNAPPVKAMRPAQAATRSEWSPSPPPTAVKADKVKSLRPSTSWFAKLSGPPAPRKPRNNAESPLNGYATYGDAPPMMGQLRRQLSGIGECPQQEIIHRAQTYHGHASQQEAAQDHGLRDNSASYTRDSIEAQAEKNANQCSEQDRQQLEQEQKEERQQNDQLLKLARQQPCEHEMGPPESRFFNAPSVSSASQGSGSSPSLRYGSQFQPRLLDPGYVSPPAGGDSPGYGDMFAPQMQGIPLGHTGGEIKAPIYQGLGIDVQRQVFGGPPPGFLQYGNGQQNSMGYSSMRRSPQQHQTSITYSSGTYRYGGNAQQPAGYGPMGAQPGQQTMGFPQGIFSYNSAQPPPMGYGSMEPPPGFPQRGNAQQMSIGYGSMGPPPGQQGYTSVGQIPGFEPYAPFIGVDSAQHAPIGSSSMRPPPPSSFQQAPMRYGTMGPPAWVFQHNAQQAPGGYRSIRPPPGLGFENAYARPPPPSMTTEQAYIVSPAHGYTTMRPQMMQPRMQRVESGYNTFSGYASRASLASSQYSVDGGVRLALYFGGKEEEEEA